MAEIRVEEKRGGLAWLWILLALLLIGAAVWYFMGMPGTQDANQGIEQGTTTPAATPATAPPPMDSVSLPVHRPTGTMVLVRT
jgi:hypothetical protein